MPRISARDRDDTALLEFWKAVADPRSIGLANALAEDLAEYRSEPVDLARQRMAGGAAEFSERWRAARIDVTNRPAVEAFYRNQFVEAYELANWHAGCAARVPPLHHARAAILA